MGSKLTDAAREYAEKMQAERILGSYDKHEEGFIAGARWYHGEGK